MCMIEIYGKQTLFGKYTVLETCLLWCFIKMNILAVEKQTNVLLNPIRISFFFE